MYGSHLKQFNDNDINIAHNIIAKSLTLGAHAQRGTAVGSVCLSVTLYLTSRMSVHLKNDTVYLTGNEGQNL